MGGPPLEDPSDNVPVGNTSETIKGIIFAIMVKRIFNINDIDIETINFTIKEQRTNGLFFQNDASGNDTTENVPNDIIDKTFEAFNEEIPFQNQITGQPDDEVLYWNIRTGIENGEETEFIPFEEDDKLLIMYEATAIFSAGTPPINTIPELDALADYGTQDSSSSVTSNLTSASGPLKFILEFTLKFSSS